MYSYSDVHSRRSVWLNVGQAPSEARCRLVAPTFAHLSVTGCHSRVTTRDRRAQVELGR